ncbi:LacI family DNA-binding transcriptional regulator [Pelagerythrobacter aerophilus]|uniref:LacI family transcriptional regulator n=1 Tax=Pelagerythrobacter aerophilus TaxID=2306995 RepID=A0A418NEZ7_9SPHN|nr:LacI family DNA-binding transcriptional regulator [Pelagerythrobacter aerophilus]RIV76894.1 LacI family transcriptional regulator [Pelagerythrobacter aerophilus]
MVTIRDVAREAGVSIATVSRALNGHSNVTKATREAIEAAAKTLNFVPHSGARSLTNRQTDTIGVILPDLFGEFFSEVIRGIDKIAHGAGKHLLLGNMHGSSHETTSAIRSMRGRVDGLLLMPPDSTAELLSDHLDANMPTVLLNAQAEGRDVPFVAVDNYHGARTITEHLIARGRKRIIHIAGPKHNRDARERLRGFADAMREGLGEKHPVVLPGDFTETAGQEAARLLLAGQVPADAVFASNDVMAVGLMSVLDEAGVAVGAETLVAGFDDIPLARHVSPKLTTMQSNMAQLGSTAAMLLLRMLRGEELGSEHGVVLSPRLAERGSTGRASPNGGATIAGAPADAA